LRKTVFSSFHLLELINISLDSQGRSQYVTSRTVSRILLGSKVIESEQRAKKEWKRFECGHPNRLIQTNLNSLNSLTILTIEDELSRIGWAIILPNH
jgi:hypothetical protein